MTNPALSEQQFFTVPEVEQHAGGGYANGSVLDPVPHDATARLEHVPTEELQHAATPLTSPSFEGERDYVHAMGRDMKAGREVPPVVLHLRDGRYDVDDGWHRVSAAVHYGVPHVRAFVFNRED